MFELKNDLSYGVFFIVLVFIDQISKYLIRFRQPADGFFICNENIAFGISLPSWIFLMLWFGSVVFLGYLFFSPEVKNSGILRWAIVAIFAGAIGNMLDRMMFGCVLDFIAVGFWPAFNLADCFITLGVVSFLAKKLKM